MDMRRFTHIGRPIDPAWPTNRAIAVITVLVGALSAIVLVLWGGVAIQKAAGLAFSSAAAVFLAWAAARELDPDHQPPAFMAAGLALVGIALTGAPPPVLPMFWLLLLLRVVNRTTGLAPRLTDLLLFVGLGVWIEATLLPFAAAATGAALWLNYSLDGRPSDFVPGLALALAVTSVLAVTSGHVTGRAEPPHWWLLLAVGAASALFVASIVKLGPVISVDDEGVAPLSRGRVRAAQGLGLVTCILILSFAGKDGFDAFIQFWAAVLAVGLSHPHSPLS